MSEFRRRLMALQKKEQPKLGAVGVFIYDIYGELTTPDDWNSANNDKAVGVYVGIENHRFVIAKEDASNSQKMGGYKKAISNVTSISNSDSAKIYYDGLGDTPKIIEYLRDYTDSVGIVGAPACEACANYIFPNGRNGYMGAIGEWQICVDNRQSIVEAMDRCGGTPIGAYNYWTSTINGTNYNWGCYWPGGGIYIDHRNYAKGVRAFLSV